MSKTVNYAYTLSGIEKGILNNYVKDRKALYSLVARLNNGKGYDQLYTGTQEILFTGLISKYKMCKSKMRKLINLLAHLGFVERVGRKLKVLNVTKKEINTKIDEELKTQAVNKILDNSVAGDQECIAKVVEKRFITLEEGLAAADTIIKQLDVTNKTIISRITNKIKKYHSTIEEKTMSEYITKIVTSQVEKYNKETQTKTKTFGKTKGLKFNNFPQREYDYDSLETELAWNYDVAMAD